MVEVQLHEHAEAELERIVAWYERRGRGLGAELLEEIALALETIGEEPDVWPPWPGVRAKLPVRRFLLPRFPFSLPYIVVGDGVIVLAVAHNSRRPRYWLKRVKR
jgi:plasmid stabilization system protein ParE